MFHWLGVLMGGAYRSDESLTLAFPPFVWKLIVGEHVTWAKDYVAIDEAAVHITGKSQTCNIVADKLLFNFCAKCQH